MDKVEVRKKYLKEELQVVKEMLAVKEIGLLEVEELLEADSDLKRKLDDLESL